MLKRVFTMTFDDDPPYDLIINTLKREITSQITLGHDLQPIIHQFEWIRNKPSHQLDKDLFPSLLRQESMNSNFSKLYLNEQMMSKKIGADQSIQSMGMGSVRNRNQINELQFSRQSSIHSELSQQFDNNMFNSEQS
jgi:hypothetical protein